MPWHVVLLVLLLVAHVRLLIGSVSFSTTFFVLSPQNVPSLLHHQWLTFSLPKDIRKISYRKCFHILVIPYLRFFCGHWFLRIGSARLRQWWETVSFIIMCSWSDLLAWSRTFYNGRALSWSRYVTETNGTKFLYHAHCSPPQVKWSEGLW